MTTDWTEKDGRTNSSDEYLRIVKVVDRLILESAHMLINGHHEVVARTIVSQLAHRQKMAPIPFDAPAARVGKSVWNLLR